MCLAPGMTDLILGNTLKDVFSRAWLLKSQLSHPNSLPTRVCFLLSPEKHKFWLLMNPKVRQCETDQCSRSICETLRFISRWCHGPAFRALTFTHTPYSAASCSDTAAGEIADRSKKWHKQQRIFAFGKSRVKETIMIFNSALVYR